MTWIWYLLPGLLLLYLLIAASVYLVQHWFFFHPEKLPMYFKFDYSVPFEELFFDTAPGVSINGLIFRVPNSRGVVYYFHGNTRSIKGWAKFSKDFTSKGYDVMMIDYRGFGKSRGKRTEEGLFHDAQYGYDWLQERYGENHIIVYGRSLGSGFAAKVASDNHPKLLILDAPYYSMLDLVAYYLPFLPVKRLLRYRIRTDKFLEKIDCPVYIFHGTRDLTVPYTSGLRLAKLLGERGHLITIRGGGHNNLRDFPLYHQQLYDVLEALPISQASETVNRLPAVIEDSVASIQSLRPWELDMFSRPGE